MFDSSLGSSITGIKRDFSKDLEVSTGRGWTP